MKQRVRVIIITGFGLNCEKETAHGFRLAGALTDLVHLNDLSVQPEKLRHYQLLAFVGGFSFGDHLGAGTVLANRVKYRLGDELRRFVGDGKLIFGICNGFQTITRLGMVPGLTGLDFTPQAALAANDNGQFRDAWVTLKCNPDSPCVFTRGIDIIDLPIRHGEGKFLTASPEILAEIEQRNLTVLRYVDPETGAIAEEYPKNPNGSQSAIAGICSPNGRIFGMMPHPEAYLSPYNHPLWLRRKINGSLDADGHGVMIFRNAVEFAQQNLSG